MEVDGVEYEPTDFLVIGVPPEFAAHPPGVVTEILPCLKCETDLKVNEHTVKVVEGGGMLYCARCALETYPNIVCGRDKETGKPLTLAEMMHRDNLDGAYWSD